MGIFRELDSRMMRDRDASAGDRGNGGDLDTLTGGTSVPNGTSGTERYGDQDTGMDTGYSSGGQMSGSGRTGGSADAADSGNRGRTNDYDVGQGRNMQADADGRDRYSRGEPLPDAGGPDVSDMGENEPNTAYGDRSGGSGRTTDMGSSRGGGMMGDMPAGDDSGTSGVGMGTGSGGNSALDLGTSTGSGGNWGDPGTTTGGGLGRNTTTSGQN